MSRMTAVFVFVCMIVAAGHGPALATAVTVDFDADFVKLWAPNPVMVIGSRLGWATPPPGWYPTSDIDTSGEYVVVGNGMVDSVELALLQAILADPASHGHDVVHTAWTANWNLLRPLCTFAGSFVGDASVGVSLNNLTAGMLTIGDGTKLNFVVTVLWILGAGGQAPGIAAQHNATAVNLLGTNGDADNDSITNLSEYTAAAGNRDAYLASNGFGDSGEGEGEGEEGEGEGEDECLNGLLADEGAFLGIYLGGTAYAPVLAAFGQTSDWNTLDLEQFEATAYAAAQELPQSSWPVPGDGLPDAIQMAMLEAVLCDPGHYLYATVVAQFEENKTFFAEDVAALEAPAFMALGNLLPGMMGTSATMQATVDALLGQGVVHLPHLADYHVFGAAKTSEDPFAADGDIDGDEISNKAEYEQVLATGGSASVAVQAIMDEHNFWPGNPALPALSAAGLVALAGALVMARFRRKQ